MLLVLSPLKIASWLMLPNLAEAQAPFVDPEAPVP
jgi:hypothetical protein